MRRRQAKKFFGQFRETVDQHRVCKVDHGDSAVTNKQMQQPIVGGISSGRTRAGALWSTLYCQRMLLLVTLGRDTRISFLGLREEQLSVNIRIDSEKVMWTTICHYPCRLGNGLVPRYPCMYFNPCCSLRWSSSTSTWASLGRLDRRQVAPYGLLVTVHGQKFYTSGCSKPSQVQKKRRHSGQFNVTHHGRYLSWSLCSHMNPSSIVNVLLIWQRVELGWSKGPSAGRSAADCALRWVRPQSWLAAPRARPACSFAKLSESPLITGFLKMGVPNRGPNHPILIIF